MALYIISLTKKSGNILNELYFGTLMDESSTRRIKYFHKPRKMSVISRNIFPRPTEGNLASYMTLTHLSTLYQEFETLILTSSHLSNKMLVYTAGYINIFGSNVKEHNSISFHEIFVHKTIKPVIVSFE
jgi:hypothetical protein